jgi:Rieske Fe-S protein
MPVRPLSRRGALVGGLVVVVGGVVGFVAAAGSAAATARRGTTTANAYGAPGSTGATSASGGGSLLVALDRVPKGGGVVLGRAKVVVTRTAGGDVHAFSAVCTHQGCVVNAVSGGSITCPCHGSRFDTGTGAATRGPATRALPAVGITVRGGNVYTS